MTDYVVPSGVRIADADRVRLGAHLAEGTTVMHEGFVQLQRRHARRLDGRGPDQRRRRRRRRLATSAAAPRSWARCRAAAPTVISIGERCLLGANAGLGISLGDDCVVEAGLYVTAGTRVTLPDGEVVKARELSRRRRPAVPPQLADRRGRGAAAHRHAGAASTPRCTPTTERQQLARRARTRASVGTSASRR